MAQEEKNNKPVVKVYNWGPRNIHVVRGPVTRSGFGNPFYRGPVKKLHFSTPQ